MKDNFSIRTSINPQLMKSTLLKGFIIALLGILLLFFGGIFLPVNILKLWGPLIFIGGMAFVIMGLLPYRKLTQLELKPMTLTAEAGGEWVLIHGAKKLLSISDKSISKIEYVNDQKNYGLGIWLNKPIEEKIIIYDPAYKVFRGFGADLFLPYFSKRSVKELHAWMQEVDEE